MKETKNGKASGEIQVERKWSYGEKSLSVGMLNCHCLRDSRCAEEVSEGKFSDSNE